MWMRFTLQERAPEGRFETVRAPGLGVWRKSRVGVAGFAYRQRVVDLAQGSSYRAVVHYRWYSRKGERLRSASRYVVDLPPGPAAQPAGGEHQRRPRRRARPGTVRYVVRVANRGRAAATGVAVSLAVDGGVIDTPVIGTIDPGETRRAVVNGPACTTSLEAEADPGESVRETVESDNVRAAPCPPASKRLTGSHFRADTMREVSAPDHHGRNGGEPAHANGGDPAPRRTAARPTGEEPSMEAPRDLPIGGQAVLEGVMMRGVSTWAVAVRKPLPEQTRGAASWTPRRGPRARSRSTPSRWTRSPSATGL